MNSKQTIMNILLFLFIVTVLFAGCTKTPLLPILPADASVLAFGDSLTFGTGAGDAESYPAVLSKLIGRKVVNAGVPGEVSAAGLQRLPGLLDQEHPALLILCHGGNDLLGHQNHQLIADNLRSMLRMARERGVAVVLVAVPAPDLSLTPPKLYEELAKEFNIPLERKSLAHILSKSSLKSDYIHPNATGYRQLAESLANLLKKSGALQ